MTPTPRQITAELRSRLIEVKKQLPSNWISVFLISHPEYADKTYHLSNVSQGKSLDKSIIKLMEDLAEKLKPSKVA